MYRRFRVQNFMCLKDVDVELRPLTIFIGPNSSGKSALFKALTTFCKLLWYPVRGGVTGDFHVEAGVTLDEAVWNGDSGLPISFEVWFDDNETDDPDYTLELGRDFRGWNVTRERFMFEGQWIDTSKDTLKFESSNGTKSWSGPQTAPLAFLTHRFMRDNVAAMYVKPIQDLRGRVGNARRYRPSASDIASFTKERIVKGRNKTSEVDEAGRGLASELQDMLGRDREKFDKMEKELHNMHSHIRGLTFRRDWRGTGLFYKTNRAVHDMPASFESDGVLLSTFLVWRVYSATGEIKICLEEPENGVHIADLKPRYELLKRFATETSNGPAPQILVATHSRDFLNSIESRNDILDEIRVVEFGASGGTVIYSLERWGEIKQLKWETKFQMGDLWWSTRDQHPKS